MKLFKKRLSSFKNWFFSLSLLKKIIIVVIILIVVVLGGRKIIAGKSNTPTYVTSAAQNGTLITSVSASGTITSANSAVISTQATGIVGKVYVKNGDYVNQGQSIASLNLDLDSQQKAAAAYSSYLGAQNSLNSAKAKMNSLQAQLFTANQTFIKGKGSSLDPDKNDPTYIIQNANWLQAESDYNNQQGVIAQSQASLNSASLSLSQNSSTITAPISGTVSNLSIAAGTQIAGSTSTTNTTSTTQTIGNIKIDGASLQATVNLSEIDVINVQVGQKVTMTLDAFSDKTFTGIVSSIDTNGSVSSGVTIYPAIITFDTSPEKIYPNMAVTATIITNVKNDVLLVPSSAVTTATDGTSTVRVMKNGKVSIVNVTVGQTNGTDTQIISGLSEGDQVVTSSTLPSTSATGSTTTASPFGNTGGLGGFGGGGGAGGGNSTFQRTSR